jgi:arsenite-transporting ATPase
MEKFFKIGKSSVRVLAPFSKRLWKVQMPTKKAMNEVEMMFNQLQEMQSLLKDSDIVSVRLVALPEKMVIEETKRNYVYLNLFGYTVDALFINGIYPKEKVNAFFKHWVDIQSKYIEDLEATFGHLSITKVRKYETDIVGYQGVEAVAKDSLAENFFDVKTHMNHEAYVKTDVGYNIELQIPLVDKDQINLYQSGTELTIKLGNFKRNIPLPDALRNCEVVRAKHEKDQLTIQFAKKGESI